jgi:hypothetical protein
LYVTDYTRVRIYLSCMLLTTLEYGYICLVYCWLHWSTDTFVLFCSWLHCSRDTFVLFCSWLPWSRDTFVLYVTDYTGIRIHLYYLLLTTLKYGYICGVCYWLHWRSDTFVLSCCVLHQAYIQTIKKNQFLHKKLYYEYKI